MRGGGMYVYSGLSSCCVTCEVRMLCLEILNDFWIRGPKFLSCTGHQNYIVSPVYIYVICVLQLSLIWRMYSTKHTNNNKIDKTLYCKFHIASCSHRICFHWFSLSIYIPSQHVVATDEWTNVKMDEHNQHKYWLIF